MATLPDAPYFDVVPDWCCEILSPSTRNRDLTIKRAIYLAEGVEHLWFVDPEAEVLESFRATGEGWFLHGIADGDDTVALAPFEAAPFDLSALWPPKADR